MGLILELRRETIVLEEGTIIPITTIIDTKNKVFVTQSDRGNEVAIIKDLLFQGILCGLGQFFDKENQHIFTGEELYTKIFGSFFFKSPQQIINEELEEKDVIHVFLDFGQDWLDYIMPEFYFYLKSGL